LKHWQAKTDSTKADPTGALPQLLTSLQLPSKGRFYSLVGLVHLKYASALLVQVVIQAGAELKIKASKVPAFKAGATLKAAVNGVKK